MTITLCVLFLSGVNKGRPWHGEGCKVEFRVGNLGAGRGESGRRGGSQEGSVYLTETWLVHILPDFYVGISV